MGYLCCVSRGVDFAPSASAHGAYASRSGLQVIGKIDDDASGTINKPKPARMIVLADEATYMMRRKTPSPTHSARACARAGYSWHAVCAPLTTRRQNWRALCICNRRLPFNTAIWDCADPHTAGNHHVSYKSHAMEGLDFIGLGKRKGRSLLTP
jgi:hypothetical protein